MSTYLTKLILGIFPFIIYRMSSIFSSEMLKDFKKLLEILSDLSTGGIAIPLL